MVSVSQQAAKPISDPIEMTVPRVDPDVEKTVPSRKSCESQKSTAEDAQTHIDHGKDAIPSSTDEPAAEQVDHSHLVANEDYSVFTVGQKRAIIFAGSFAAWFSPMVSQRTLPFQMVID